MAHDKKLISLLLEEGFEDPFSSTLCLSAYIPIHRENRQDLYGYIKSCMLTGLRNSDLIKDYTTLHHHIIDQILTEASPLSQYTSGIAIFGKFDKYASGLPIFKEDTLHIINLTSTPEKQFNIDKIYDLDQLIWWQDYNPSLVVLNVERKKSDVFSYHHNNLDLITTLTNPSEYQEHSETKGPSRQNGIIASGSGDFKLRNSIQEADKRFVRLITDYISKTLPTQEHYDALMLFYSTIFSRFKENIIEVFEKKQKMEPILIPRHVSNEQLIKEAQKTFVDVQARYKKSTLEQAKKLIKGHYIEGWEKVIEAANNGRIDTLFIQHKAQRQGVIKNNQITGDKFEGGFLVDNINPWLVRDVLNTGGELMVFKNQQIGKGVEVAAKLRY